VKSKTSLLKNHSEPTSNINTKCPMIISIGLTPIRKAEVNSSDETVRFVEVD